MDIKVGKGPVTVSGIVFMVVAGLTSLASFLTTLLGALPEGVSPTVGVVISAIAGGASAVAFAITAAARHLFAKLKAGTALIEASDDPWGWVDVSEPTVDDIDDVIVIPTDVGSDVVIPVEPE